LEIKIGKYDLLNSGVIICASTEQVEIKISNSFILRMVFNQDSSNTIRRIEPSISEDKFLVLKFVNFKDAIGVSHVIPLPLGTLDNRKLYFNYSVSHSRGDNVDIFSFSYEFLLGENV
jgi:hypothetical protein